MQVLIKPVITEKGILGNAEGRYVFDVNCNANKIEIAQAIKEFYKVEIKKVNIIRSKSEEKVIRGRFKGKTKASKRAIVFLKKGQKIPGFEEK